MLTLNVVVYGDDKFITGSFLGKNFNLKYSEELFNKLKALQDTYDGFTDAELIPLWEEDVKILLTEKVEDIIETACPDLRKDPRTGNYFVVVEGKISKTPVPANLVDVILESVDKNIDPTPVVKAWIRFLRNPNFTADKAANFARYITAVIVDYDEAARLMEEEGFTEEEAEKRSSYNDVSITQEGLIVCKKYAELITEGWAMDTVKNQPVKVDLYPASPDTCDRITGKVTKGEVTYPNAEELYFMPPVQRMNGDEFYCGSELGHTIRVGQRIFLDDWKKVNTDDYVSCVKGLHVGGWQYVSSYKGLNCQLIDCFVDPAEIGAICGLSASSDGAMRVREYFTYAGNVSRNKGIYHSSTYAKMKDAEWEDYKKKAVEESNKLLAKISAAQDQIGL